MLCMFSRQATLSRFQNILLLPRVENPPPNVADKLQFICIFAKNNGREQSPYIYLFGYR